MCVLVALTQYCKLFFLHLLELLVNWYVTYQSHISMFYADVTTSAWWRCANDGQRHSSTAWFTYTLCATLLRGTINKKLSYRRETARQLRLSFYVRLLIVQFTEHRTCCIQLYRLTRVVSAKKLSDIHGQWSLKLSNIIYFQGHLSFNHYKAVKSFHNNIYCKRRTATHCHDVWEMTLHNVSNYQF